MQSRSVEIVGPGGSRRPGFLALPSEATRPAPGLVVLHEILGLNDDIRRIVERFAAAGYATLAPDLYAGPGPRPLCVLRTLRSLGRAGGPAFAAIEQARGFLAARPEVDGTRMGVAGFCMGGGFALLYALRAPLAAAAIFYGDVPQEVDALRGVCPVVAGFGARDRLFAAAGRRLDRLLAELDVEHDVALYPEAGHSYMNRHPSLVARIGAVSPLRVGYDEAAAEDSWRRMLAFFARHLAGSADPGGA